MTMLKRYLPLAAIAAFLSIVAVGAIASGYGDDPPGSDVEQIAAIESEASEAMAVLATARDGGDALPAELAEGLDERARFGMNPDLSRRSIANMTNSLYAVPASGHVCAVLTLGDGANGICPSTAEIAAGEAPPATVVLDTGDIGIYGLVPDGVESVSVEIDGAEPEEAQVEGNGYYAVVDAETAIETVSYDGPGGPVEFPIYDPAAGFTE
jgi:hypothetical protein